MRIIRGRAGDYRIVEDDWRHVTGDEALGEGKVIVDLARWQAERATLKARGEVGVKLPSDTQPEDLVDALGDWAMVAVEFPKFTDGRGYSIGRMLRDRYGYTGELRAVGDVLHDQLLYMARCGFDAFELKAGKDIEGALAAFDTFSVYYQGAADEPQPLWRRARA